MKNPFTIIFENELQYLPFLSVVSSIYDQARNVILYIGKKVRASSKREQYALQNADTPVDPSKLTIKRRVDIYKKRNQSASSSRQNHYSFSKENEGSNENPYSQIIAKKSQDLILDQYQNHYFGRCMNRYTKTTINPTTSRTYQDNVVNETLIKQIEDSSLHEDDQDIKKNTNTNLEIARPNFRRSSNIFTSNQNGQQQQHIQNEGQHYSLTVPQSNTRTKRPSIVLDKDQINLNNGGSSNKSNTPYNSTLSTITPRHSSISARSRKYKRQKNISFDQNNPSRTINFYAESNKIQQQDDELFSRLNKTTNACNYYEPNIESKKNDTDISFYQNANQNSEQSEQKVSQQDFYPSFTKKTMRPNNIRTATQNGQDQSDWSLVSIKSPKLQPTIDSTQNENINQFFMNNGQKKIKIIRKRSSKLSNTTEDEDEIRKGLNIEIQSQVKTSPSKQKMNHLLSNVQSFKTKTEQAVQDTSQEKLIGKEEPGSVKNKSDQDQINLLKEITGYQVDQGQKCQQKPLDSLSTHKETQKQGQTKQQQQDNSNQLQHSVLLRPSSAQKNNENSSSPKKYGNIPKPQSSKKSDKKEFQEQVKVNVCDFSSKIQEKQSTTNSYLKQLYDFNQNKEMNDENSSDTIQDESDAYKIIFQDEKRFVNNSNSNSINTKMNIENQYHNMQIRTESLNLENDQNKQNRGNDKSLSPLKNQTNKIQLQTGQNQQQSQQQQQERGSYQFNEQKNINQKQQVNQSQSSSYQFNDSKHQTPKYQQTPNNHIEQSTKQLQQVNDQNSNTNINKIKQQTQLNVNSLQNTSEAKLKPKGSLDKREDIIIEQINETQIKQNHTAISSDKPSKIITESKKENTNLLSVPVSKQQNNKHEDQQQAPIEYHDFDNSFDNESFSQIKKVDEIIQLIEEQSAIVLQNQNQIINKLNKCNSFGKKDFIQEHNKNHHHHKQEILIEQQNIQQTEQSGLEEAEQPIPNNYSIYESPSKDINYDWNSLKDPNYKPTTSPLKERLFVVDDDTKNKEVKEKSQSPEGKKNDSLMIVMTHKNENNNLKKKDKPTLRQRDVFQDEFWNPVTNPRNYKVTNNLPDLNEEKYKEKQILVPVKIKNEENDVIEYQQNEKSVNNQYHPDGCESNNDNCNNKKYDNKDVDIYGNKINNIFDEVKDFFKPSTKNSYQNQGYKNNKTQNNLHQSNITSSSSSNNQNNNGVNKQQAIQNNYEDWDD